MTDHPDIVTVYPTGTCGDAPFMVLAYLVRVAPKLALRLGARVRCRITAGQPTASPAASAAPAGAASSSPAERKRPAQGAVRPRVI